MRSGCRTYAVPPLCHNHEDGRRDANERMRPKARRTPMKRALKADHRANYKSADNPADNDQIGMIHDSVSI
jgi:hypothetical protein